MEPHQQALTRARVRLLEDMEPTYLLDCLISKEVIPHIVYRNIQEQKTTSDKNRKIIDLFMTKDNASYMGLKRCLEMSHQKHLAAFLTEQEKDIQKQVSKVPKGGQERQIGQKTKELSKSMLELNINSPKSNVHSDRPQSAYDWVFDVRTHPENPNQQPSNSVVQSHSKLLASNMKFESIPTKKPPSGTVTALPPSDIEQERQIFQSNTILTVEKCFYYGQLTHLTPKELKAVKTYVDRVPIDSGGFGKVYHAQNGVPGLKIPLALKEIECFNDEFTKSFINEMLASRLMHFAVVPVLAVARDEQGEKIFHYLLSPFLANGNLRNAIQNDNILTNKVLGPMDRIRILYQISSAISFLHTPVNGLRNITLHRDITSNNVVLDEQYNARLIDFGLSYELKDRSSHHTKLPCRTPGYTGDDVKDFGIIIRELLTGKSPVEGGLASHDEYDIKDYIEESLPEIWCQISDQKKTCSKEASKLVDLSEICLGNKELDRSTIDYMTEELGMLLNGCCGKRWCRIDPGKCEVCIVNPAAKECMMQDDLNSCRTHIRPCVACLQNIYLNPIKCHSCTKNVIPTIGHQWGALLIAGSAMNSEDKNAKEFIHGVHEFRKICTSKTPLIMGLSEVNVVVVEPDDKVSMTDKVSNEIASFKDKDIRKLIIYYSGHYNDGFVLGKKGNDCYKSKDLHTEFIALHAKNNRIKSFVIILDCCFGPNVTHPPDIDLTQGIANIAVVQINACESDKVAANVDGGMFTRFLIQALQGESVQKPCFLQLECSICHDFRQQHKINDCITVTDLVLYTNQHLQKYGHNNMLEETQKIVHHQCNATADEFIFAYYINYEVRNKFWLTHGDQRMDSDVSQHSYITRIEELRVILFEKFIKEMHLPELNVTDFADIICIVLYKKTDQLTDEIDSIDKVASAWNAHLEPIVTLRDCANICKGKVGLFLPDQNADCLLQKFQEFPQDKKDNYLTVLINTDTGLSGMPEKFKNEKIFRQAISKIKLALEREKNKSYSQLEIIFPYDKNGQISVRKDFVCFNLLKK